MALNGGPLFRYSEAISLQVPCKTQEQIDYFWQKLSARPGVRAVRVAEGPLRPLWQIVPADMAEMMSDSDAERAGRVMTAMLEMKKIDIERLREAYEGANTTATSVGRGAELEAGRRISVRPGTAWKRPRAGKRASVQVVVQDGCLDPSRRAG